MDIGNISTPFLVDGFRLEITLQNILFGIGNASLIGMMVVFLYYNRGGYGIHLAESEILMTMPVSNRSILY